MIYFNGLAQIFNSLCVISLPKLVAAGPTVETVGLFKLKGVFILPMFDVTHGFNHGT
jgi:hypothetical protein